jgi:hypothetical protein
MPERRALAALGLLFAFTSCAAMTLQGQDFSRPDYQTLSANKLTEREVLAKYGQPFSRLTFTQHGKLIRTLRYFYETREFTASGDVSYESKELSSFRNHIYRRKECLFFFAGDEYLGFDFSTGFEEGQSVFSETKVPAIVKGATRKADVIAMFGIPTGAFRYPVTPEETSVDGDTALAYEYHYLSDTAKSFHERSLRVTFGKDDVVKDVHFGSRDREAEDSPAAGNDQLTH